MKDYDSGWCSAMFYINHSYKKYMPRTYVNNQAFYTSLSPCDCSSRMYVSNRPNIHIIKSRVWPGLDISPGFES